MDKGNWVPLDKGLIRTLGNIGRPYSYVEAMFCHQYNVDCGNEFSINGYAKLWKWDRKKVRNFLGSIGTGKGHEADRKGTGRGQVVRFVFKGLQAEADRKGTGRGQEGDRYGDTNINPNPNPNPKKEKDNKSDKSDLKEAKNKKFIPPTVEEVEAFCRSRGNGISGQHFVDSNQAKGWVTGKLQNPIKDWKAVVRTWENYQKDKTVRETRTQTTTTAADIRRQMEIELADATTKH